VKGKQAAAAARRREADALAEVEKVKREKAEQKAKHEEEINRLRTELAELRNNVAAEAARLAGEEVRRLLEEKQAERQARGLSDATVEALAERKDALIKQACRYISMQTGEPPMMALRVVITWMSGEPYGGQVTEDWLVQRHGLPRDGWVMSLFRLNRYADRAQGKAHGYATMTLDQAEESEHPAIHPGYRTEWYEAHPRLGKAMIRAQRRR
jgi:hypothetical protein